MWRIGKIWHRTRYSHKDCFLSLLKTKIYIQENSEISFLTALYKLKYNFQDKEILNVSEIHKMFNFLLYNYFVHVLYGECFL